MTRYPPVDRSDFKPTLPAWEREFRRAAKADGYGIFRDHLNLLGLHCPPVKMMRATILMMSAMAVYYQIDQWDYTPLLAMQVYNPARSPKGVYVFTFDLFGRAYARLLADPEEHTIDLADLFDHPWPPYEISGYKSIWISHTDWSDVTKAEVEFLEERVTDDLRFDYREDEVNFWFDDSNPKYLYVEVHDV